MSDLTATNCGCGCDNSCDNGCSSGTSIFGGNGNCGCSLLWVIILLGYLGNGNSCGCNSGCDNGCGNNLWILILLLLFCGNGNGSCLF